MVFSAIEAQLPRNVFRLFQKYTNQKRVIKPRNKIFNHNPDNTHSLSNPTNFLKGIESHF